MEDFGMKVNHEVLFKFCMEAMRKCGMAEDQAQTTAEVLVSTDLWGVSTHGTRQLRLLLKNLREGGIKVNAVPKQIAEGPAWALIDGHFAMPMVTSTQAMKLAISKARETGVAYVGVKGSSHFGAAGYYANMAVQENMIGLAMSNVDPCMAAPGGKIPMLGTNPIAFAVPAGKAYPVFLDIATSVAAVSKVYACKTLGKKLPDKWLVDKEGIPTDDPAGYPEQGAILPMAGHKGYGLAVLVEVLSAVLTGALFTLDVKCWLRDFATPVNEGHAFMAIDIGQMMPVLMFKERMDQMIFQIHEAPKARGTERIYLPGEMEWEKRQKALREGIDLPEEVVLSLRGLAEDVGLDIKRLFP
jgi:ureidoglycolate dehydrogenase (NAD+)